MARQRTGHRLSYADAKKYDVSKTSYSGLPLANSLLDCIFFYQYFTTGIPSKDIITGAVCCWAIVINWLKIASFLCFGTEKKMLPWWFHSPSLVRPTGRPLYLNWPDEHERSAPDFLVLKRRAQITQLSLKIQSLTYLLAYLVPSVLVGRSSSQYKTTTNDLESQEEWFRKTTTSHTLYRTSFCGTGSASGSSSNSTLSFTSVNIVAHHYILEIVSNRCLVMHSCQ